MKKLILVVALSVATLDVSWAGAPFGRMMPMHYSPNDNRTIVVPKAENTSSDEARQSKKDGIAVLMPIRPKSVAVLMPIRPKSVAVLMPIRPKSVAVLMPIRPKSVAVLMPIRPKSVAVLMPTKPRRVA